MTHNTMDKLARDAILKAIGVEHYDGKATVTSNGKTETIYAKLVDSDRNEVDPEAEFLTKKLILACSFVSNKPTLTRGKDEDTINCLVRDNLKMLFSGGEYSVPDQSEQGESESRKKVGEVDILIEREQIIVALVEALNHKDKTRLHEHIRKAIDNYNPSGIRKIYILSYLRDGASFDKFWEDINRWASEAVGIEVWGETKTGFGAIKCLEGCYNHNGITGKIFFIGANVQ